MRRSRIYTPQSLKVGDTLELEDSSSHYLMRVLRLSGGDAVTLFNGDGSDYRGAISEIQGKRISVGLLESLVPGNESPLEVTLVQAISRGERMDHCLQKATELGVFRIQPVISSRVEVRLDENRQARRLKHWQCVVISACEQSGRARIPEVKAPLSLTDWMADSGGAQRLVLDPGASVGLSSFSPAGTGVSVVVGPEGGFSTAEMRELLDYGCTAVSMGPRILRTETAGPAAIAVLQTVAGDF